MKKFVICLLFLLLPTFIFSGCAKEIDYNEYVSEKRTNVYLYESDTLNLKIYASEKETPYLLDGIKGKTNPIIEIFAEFTPVPESVIISVENHSGEMNYHSVGCYFYLSFSSQDFKKPSLDVSLTYSNKTETITANSVLYDGVIAPEKALFYAVNYDSETFNSLIDKNFLNAELHVRLLYDEKCYYYVGVCDTEGNVTAYLIDGEKGTVIAKKNLKN